MRLAAPKSFQLSGIPSGVAGTRQTLKIMARLVKDYRTNPTIRNVAADMVQHLPGMSFHGEAKTLFDWVQRNVRYLQDVNDVETIQAPDVTLQDRRGDCDDQATLLAALLESIGHPVRFVAIGYTNPSEFDHVFVETRIGDTWEGCDTTVPEAYFGWSPEPPYTDDVITARMVHNV